MDLSNLRKELLHLPFYPQRIILKLQFHSKMQLRQFYLYSQDTINKSVVEQTMACPSNEIWRQRKAGEEEKYFHQYITKRKHKSYTYVKCFTGKSRNVKRIYLFIFFIKIYQIKNIENSETNENR